MSFIKDYAMNSKREAAGKKAVIEIKSAQDSTTIARFPAFITSFTDSFSSTWSEEQVYGRIDPIGTFQGTKRSINLGFDIVSYNETESKSNMKEINKITQMLYPSYNDVGEVGEGNNGNALILSKSPLVEIKFGNLIQENGGFLLGWITTWSANPVLEMGMFTPEAGQFLPKVYNATFAFTPQHRKDLAFNSTNTAKTKFPYDGGE